MTQPKTSRIPAPLYAAAGAGELALQQLRKLPAVVTDLSGKVVADLGGKAVVTGFELRQKATDTLRTANLTAGGLREKAVPADLDLDKLREAASRNAAAVLAGAQAAQERALAAYAGLVARGERVVGAGVLEAAETVNADIEATEVDATVATPARATATAPAGTTEVPTPADVAEVVEAKPAPAKTTRTRAAKPAATPSGKLPKATRRTRPAAE
jgi:heparin binding hemagglutinin HbhA